MPVDRLSRYAATATTSTLRATAARANIFSCAAATVTLGGAVSHADIISWTGPQSIAVNGGSQDLYSGATPPEFFLRAWNSCYSSSTSASVKVNLRRLSGGGPNVDWFFVTAGNTITAGTASLLYPRQLDFTSGDFGDPAKALRADGTEHVVGFRFQGSSSNLVGWMSYTLSYSDPVFAFTINAWAYNDAGGSIIAGQMSAGGGGAVPGLGGLAALACGAAGVRSRRQRVA